MLQITSSRRSVSNSSVSSMSSRHLRRFERLENRLMCALDLAAYIDNLNFDEYSALPTGLDQMQYAGQTVDYWKRLTNATTDYLHADGYLGENSDAGTITPRPMGEGFVGLAVDNSAIGGGVWYEYAATYQFYDLGSEYVLDLHVGTTAADDVLGGAFEGEIAIFGLPVSKEEYDLDFLFGNTHELTHTVELMETIPIDQAASTWETYQNISFTPTKDMMAIIFGVRTEMDTAYVLLDAETSAPKVTEVTVDGTGSTHAPYNFSTVDGSGEQLRTVPVGGANSISITFSEDVTNINYNSLAIEGLLTGAIPQPASSNPFQYNSNTHVATWTFNAPLAANQYHLSLSDAITDAKGLKLDGEWTNPFHLTTTNVDVSEFPSGNGIAGGDFNFVMTILPGDANRDNEVDSLDYSVYLANGGGPGRTFAQADFNGDGYTNIDDYNIYAANSGKLLADLVFADFDHDGIVDDDDVGIHAMNVGTTNASHADGDADNDGDVDKDDEIYLEWHYGLELDWVV